MELIHPLDFVNDQLFANSLQLKDSIVPFYHFQKKRIKILGSSVYLTFNDRYFLATASHVIEGRPVIFSDPELTISLPNVFVGFPDPIDVSVAELSGPLEKYQPLHVKQMRNFAKLPTGGRFFASGFPGSKTHEDRKVIDSTLITIFSGGEKKVEFERLNVAQQWAFGFHYPKKGLKDFDGKPTNQVNAHGMSGGGVFWISDRGHRETVPSFLVGILVRWDDKISNTLVGMGIVKIVELLSGLVGTSIEF